MAAWDGSRPVTWIRSPRVEVPAIGYGIRYEFGIFDQAIRDGWQVRDHGQVAALRQSLGDRAAGDHASR